MVFHMLSREIYNWLKNQEFVKEETLTDWLLYNSSIRCPYLLYKSFTRNEESKNGADWEWWIITEKEYDFAAYRFLVQAKKLHNNVDNYSAISYGNKNGLQIDLLIDTAIRRNAFPVYSFYSTTQPNINQQIKNFGCFNEKWLRWCEPCINGVFLTSAKRLRKSVIEVPKKKIYDTELINNSLGLSLLDGTFCNELKNEDVNKDILEIINNYYIKEIEGEKYKTLNNEVLGIKYDSNQLPRYVQLLMSSNDNKLSWLEQEFSNELSDINGVVVLDLRKCQNKL